MMKSSPIPKCSYGVLSCDQYLSEFEKIAHQVRRLGYSILDSGLSKNELQNISNDFKTTHDKYIEIYNEQRLREANEIYTIRGLLIHGGLVFRKLATNENLLSVLDILIKGKYILNQQNGVINPAGEAYNQGGWHRDLPYQHYISSSPLAINALFCVDDFTFENGSTFVLPATHKEVDFPCRDYVESNAIQIQAKAGQFILLDCMVFHSGGFNSSNVARRAINHVYTIPYFKQQINIPKNIKEEGLSERERELLGFDYIEPSSIEEYIESRI